MAQNQYMKARQYCTPYICPDRDYIKLCTSWHFGGSGFQGITRRYAILSSSKAINLRPITECTVTDVVLVNTRSSESVNFQMENASEISFNCLLALVILPRSIVSSEHDFNQERLNLPEV